jgi:hypothetical protein
MLRRASASLAATLLFLASCTPAPTGAAPSVSASATEGPAAGTQPCASGGLALSSIEVPPPATSAAATSAAPRTSSPATPAASTPVPSPTPTPRPAPSADRIGFPDGYQTAFKFLYVYDRADAKSVTYVCGNDTAAATRQGKPFAFGSVMVFESWRPKEDAQGNLIKDASGHLIRATLNAIFVMKKDQGFGEAYQQFRTGEWEYVAYRPDKTYQTPPSGSATCSSCHQASNKDRDWTFRAWDLPFTTRYAIAPVPPVGEVSLNRMAFFPNVLSVAVGATVKWTNSAVDKLDHTVSSPDGLFNSGTLKPGETFTFTFAKAGTYQYICSFHPDQMRARVEVK